MPYTLRVAFAVQRFLTLIASRGIFSLSGVNATLTKAGSGSINVGTLVSDGVATPEQIALWLPTTGTVSQSATATCRYKPTASSTWTTGHSLYRVQPTLQINTPVWGGAIQDGFAWTIIDLQPGTSYDIEVLVTEGVNSVYKLLTHTTRSLPGTAGTANKTATNITNLRTALAGLNPGDVLEIAAGTYSVGTTPLDISRSGTTGSPIYIRGASRTGTIISRSGSGGDIFSFGSAANIIFENFTIQGGSTDGSISNTQKAFATGSNTTIQTNITIRNLIVTGVDGFVDMIGSLHPTDVGQYNSGWLVYNNTATGNNLWTTPYLESNATWNDHGIQIPGRGNCAWQNTMTGFGDTFSFAEHFGGGECDSIGVHYYRNEIRRSCDDVIEADHGRRNCTFYDNRTHNSVNATSLDPVYAGPIIFARNIWINLLRARAHKWNSTNCGFFLYNNTVLMGIVQDNWPNAFGDMCGWYQPDNGGQRSFGYRNNIHVYRGNSDYAGNMMLRFDNASSGSSPDGNYQPMDWTHNSWYPDRSSRIPYNATAYTATLSTLSSVRPSGTPVFSGLPHLSNDNITVSNPWASTITFTGNAYTEYSGTFLPTLAAATAPKNSGVAIPNITDGYTGAAPDRGAVIEGRAAVSYGDQTNIATALATAAATTGFDSNEFLVFHGRTNLTAQYGLSYEQPHPTSGILCDPTEDGSTSASHTAIDWASKGIYDPTSKRVMWASCGAGNNFAGGYVYNTHAIYDETANTWSVSRGFQCPNEGDTYPIVHMYDGMCIDVVGRKFYRKKFPSAFMMVYDLSTDAWVNGFATPSNEASYARMGAIEFIPTRGTSGAIWLFSWASSNDQGRLWEYQIGGSGWTTLIDTGNFGGANPDTPCMSYNPRAFGGAGGVLIGSLQGNWTVRCDTLAVATVGAPPEPLVGPYQAHMCRDPVGTGWLLASDNGNMYRCDGSTWTFRAALPDQLASNNHNQPLVMVPIDDYGVVWMVTQAGSTNRAWLYKP